MSWQTARDLGRDWVAEHFPSNIDLDGRRVQFAQYKDEETCRFFHHHWSLQFRGMVVKAAARAARVRGATTTYKTITLQDYLTWLESKTDNPDQRRAFLDTIECVIN